MAGGACREKTSTGDGGWGSAEMALGTPGAHSTPSWPSNGKQRTEGTELLQDGNSLMFYFSGSHRKPPWGCIRSTARATGHSLQVPGLSQTHREDEAIPSPPTPGRVEGAGAQAAPESPASNFCGCENWGGAEPANRETVIHSQQLPHAGPNKRLRRCPCQGFTAQENTALPIPPGSHQSILGLYEFGFYFALF